MSAFARGCLEFLIVWLVASLGLYYFFETRFSAPGPLWGAIGGGFLFAAGWGLTRNALMSRGQANLIRESLVGAMPFADRPYAAIGRAIALESPLLTPFKRQPCVLYSCELSERRSVRVRTAKGMRTDSQRIVYFSGLAMTHWAVETASGPVRVCGFPVPDQFKEVGIDINQNYIRICEYCEETDFTRVGKWEIGKMLNFAGLVLGESTGPVRKDLWFDGADEVVSDRALLAQCRLIEQSIAVDEPICVIGKFDQVKNGLVNDFHHGGLQVLAGDANQAIRHLRRSTSMYLIFALVCMLLAILGSFGILTLRERSLAANQPIVDSSQELVAAFEADDWEKFSGLLSQGISPDSRDSAGRPLLLAAIDRRKPAAIDALLTTGADVNAVQTQWNRRPIEAAFDRGEWDLVDRLQTLGASGDFVEMNSGEPLTSEIPDLESLLNQYSQSLDQSDASLMASISDHWPADYLESVGRGLYKDTRPQTWKCMSGYRQGDLATFVAEGKTRREVTERYVITACQRQEGWKLRRVYWDDLNSFSFRP